MVLCCDVCEDWVGEVLWSDVSDLPGASSLVYTAVPLPLPLPALTYTQLGRNSHSNLKGDAMRSCAQPSVQMTCTNTVSSSDWWGAKSMKSCFWSPTAHACNTLCVIAVCHYFYNKER